MHASGKGEGGVKGWEGFLTEALPLIQGMGIGFSSLPPRHAVCYIFIQNLVEVWSLSLNL